MCKSGPQISGGGAWPPAPLYTGLSGLTLPIFVLPGSRMSQEVVVSTSTMELESRSQVKVKLTPVKRQARSSQAKCKCQRSQQSRTLHLTERLQRQTL